MKKFLISLLLTVAAVSNVFASDVYVFDMAFKGQENDFLPSNAPESFMIHGTIAGSIIQDVNPGKEVNNRTTRNSTEMARTLDTITGEQRTVINVSLSARSMLYKTCSPVLQYSIDKAIARGIVIVVSAGNNFGDDAINYAPANCKGVIVVGSSGFFGVTRYSNTGDIVTVYTAPGTYEGKTLDGTSFSAPVVTGLVSKWLDNEPELTQEEIVMRLQEKSNSSKILKM